LRIYPGERVGIIGKLGSGKSTMLRLILNQYAPSAGSVLVDGIVNTQLEPLSLRRQIGYVPQDVTLFHGTLRENIELGRVQASDAQLVEAMHVAGLDEIVAIARALLTRPRLLLMDQPSSMIDPGNEQKLISRLRALGDTTILLVTHRMAILALVDRLIVMDRGRVVADGRHDEMLKALAQQQNPPAKSGDGAAANDMPPRAAPAGPAPGRAAGDGAAACMADRVKGER